MTIQRRKIKLATIGAACAITLTMHAGMAQAQTEDHAEILAALRTLQAAAGPGAAVHADADGEDWTLSAGTGTTGADRPIQRDEHFLVGSQTKSFTATVVLQLVDEGKFDLNTPIETYLPGLVTGNGYDGTRITVRHLLQHTSGIAAFNPGVPSGPTPPRNSDGSFNPHDVVRMGLERDPVSVPGVSITYSNTNYMILGLLVEAVTGSPVREAVRSRVIEPLGLTRTFFPAPGDRTVPQPKIIGYHGGADRRVLPLVPRRDPRPVPVQQRRGDGVHPAGRDDVPRGAARR